MISDEAVEAAARAMFPDNVGPAYNLALRALEAAAPYLAAEAWDEGWQACVNYSTYPELDGEIPNSENPYRSQA